MYNAADRKDIRAAEKLAAEIERERDEFIVASMSVTQGRTYFHNLLSRCHLFNSSFAPDPHVTAFSEGERNIGLQIYADILRLSPNQFITMMQEASIKEQAIGRRTSPADDASDAELPGGED
jgi:hypothetical protein